MKTKKSNYTPTPLFLGAMGVLLFVTGMLVGVKIALPDSILAPIVVQQAQAKAAQYECPAKPWVDCMPSTDSKKNPQCAPDFLAWAKKNCAQFKGVAY